MTERWPLHELGLRAKQVNAELVLTWLNRRFSQRYNIRTGHDFAYKAKVMLNSKRTFLLTYLLRPPKKTDPSYGYYMKTVLFC